ncbi:uncharacterized protein TNCV_3637591 [Trichonephila clavipes]|nr:uncharacterized protein TNCV_3637591 [Trichonephila clavipes]
MGKDHLVTIAISDYKTSVENMELSPPVQYNASPDDNSRTLVTVSLCDVTGIKPCPNRFPNQLLLRTVRGTKTTFIRKEDDLLVLHCSCFSRAALNNIFDNCTYGLEGIPNARNSTFIDSEFCAPPPAFRSIFLVGSRPDTEDARGRIIDVLECKRIQMKLSEELGTSQSVISKLWKRFQDDGMSAVTVQVAFGLQRRMKTGI